MNIKPIFKEELELLEMYFNITDIPQNCWKKKGGWVLAPTKEGLINVGRLNSKFGGEITFTPSNVMPLKATLLVLFVKVLIHCLVPVDEYLQINPLL